jgi:tetratricopeptide (TPR) repeat protein
MNSNTRSIKLDQDERDIFSKESMLRKTKISVEDNKKLTSLEICFQGKLNEGLKLANNNFNNNGQHSSHWNLIGTCYLFNKKYDQAAFYYKIGLSYDKEDYSILNNLAFIEIQKENFIRAYKLLNNAVKFKTNSNVLDFNLASLHFYFGKYEKSLELLNRLQRQNKYDPDTNILIGRNYIFLEDYKKALNSFKFVPDKFKDKKEVRVFKSFALMKLGDYESAKELLRYKRRPGSVNVEAKLISLIDEKLKKQRIQKAKEGK